MVLGNLFVGNVLLILMQAIMVPSNVLIVWKANIPFLEVPNVLIVQLVLQTITTFTTPLARRFDLGAKEFEKC